MYLEKDATGEVAIFANYQTDWSPANPEDPLVSQEKIDAFELERAKKAKIATLKKDLNDFLLAGYIYDEHIYSLTDRTTDNIQLKNTCSLSMPDRFKFCDNANMLVDFTDAAGFVAFLEAALAEKDRVMVKYNAYKIQIVACVTVAEVENIIIVFSI